MNRVVSHETQEKKKLREPESPTSYCSLQTRIFKRTVEDCPFKDSGLCVCVPCKQQAMKSQAFLGAEMSGIRFSPLGLSLFYFVLPAGRSSHQENADHAITASLTASLTDQAKLSLYPDHLVPRREGICKFNKTAANEGLQLRRPTPRPQELVRF